LPPGRKFDAVICDRLCHTVTDVRAWLESLRDRLTEHGLIYLTAYNYLWEFAARMAETVGWKTPAPTTNWLSHNDFHNLFNITGLEMVRFEDRLLLPLQVPGLAPLVNRYLAKLPLVERFSLYRLYALRRRDVRATPRPLSVSVVVPTRNEAGNVAAAIERTPVMGSSTELIFVEGGSSDGTWDTIANAIKDYRGPLKLSAYQQTGKGKGDAVRLGFAKATGDVLMILDADLTVPPEDLPRFYEAWRSHKGEYVNGVRLVYPMEERAMRAFNFLGNKFFSLAFSWLLSQSIKDTLCGTKVLSKAHYEMIAANRSYFGDFDPFGDFDLIFGAAKYNLKFVDLPIRYRERTYGDTNIQRWSHGWLLLRMVMFAMRRVKFI
jgi:hypothetical protein